MGVRLVRERMTVSFCEARNTLYQAFMKSRTRGEDVVCLPTLTWLCLNSLVAGILAHPVDNEITQIKWLCTAVGHET